MARTKSQAPLTAVALPPTPAESESSHQDPLANESTDLQDLETAANATTSEQTVIVGRPVKLLMPRTGNGNSNDAPLPPEHPAERLINTLQERGHEFEVVPVMITPKYQELESFRNMRLEQIRAALQANGKADYRLLVKRNGITVPGSQGSLPMSIGGPALAEVKKNGAEEDEEDEEKRLKKKAGIERAVIAHMQSAAEKRRIQRDIEREERQAQEEDETRRQMKPLNAVAEKLDQTLAKLATDKPDMFEQLGKLAPLITALAPMLKRDESPMVEAMKEISRQNQATTERMMILMQQMNKPADSDTKVLSLLIEMVRAKSDQPNAFELYREARREAREEFQELHGGDDVEIDPNNIFGSIAAAGIKGLYHLARTGGPQIAQTIQQITANMGRTPATVTDADEQSLMLELSRLKAAKRIKQPPAARLPAAQAPKQLAESATPAVSGPSGNPPQTPQQQAVVESPQAPPSEEAVTDLRESVTQAIREAIVDLDLERDTPLWINRAIDEWGGKFMRNFCATTPRVGGDAFVQQRDCIAQQFSMIGAHCDLTVYGELCNRLGANKSVNNERMEWHFYCLMYCFNNPTEPCPVRPVPIGAAGAAPSQTPQSDHQAAPGGEEKTSTAGG